MNKKILVVSRKFWPEDVRANDLCEGLTQAGYKIDVLCGQPSSPSGRFMKGYNSFKIRRESHGRIDIYRCVDVERSNSSNLRIFLYYTVFPVSASFLVKKLLNRKYDAVLVYQYSPVMSAVPGLKIAGKLGIPSYIYVAEAWPEKVFDVIDVRSSVFRKFLYAISDRIYKKADFLIVPTEKMKKDLEHRLFMEKSRIYVTPGFSQEHFCTEIRDDSLLEKMAGSFNAAIFGDLDGRLDYTTVIGTVLMLRSNGIRNIRFIVTGTGYAIERLYELMEENDLYEYFFFEGKVADKYLGKYIHLTDIILYIPVPGESGMNDMPQSFVNYLAASRPVISACEGCVRDVIRTAGCGMSAAPSDSGNLYSCIMKIFQMPASERAAMGENAKEYQLRYFDRDTNIGMISDILNGMPLEEAPDDSGIKNISDM